MSWSRTKSLLERLRKALAEPFAGYIVPVWPLRMRLAVATSAAALFVFLAPILFSVSANDGAWSPATAIETIGAQTRAAHAFATRLVNDARVVLRLRELAQSSFHPEARADASQLGNPASRVILCGERRPAPAPQSPVSRSRS